MSEGQVKQWLQNLLFRFPLQQTLAKFTQHRRIEARIGQIETEHVLPIQPPTNGVSSLLKRSVPRQIA